MTTLDGSEALIHVEVENPWRRTFPFRMFEYFTLLRFSHGLPIFQIAIFPERRMKPFGVESYREKLFNHEALVCTYFHIGLAGLSVDKYWSDGNPVSWAFSAFMDKGNRDKVQLMVDCFRRVYESPFKDNDKLLLLDFIRTYYQLTPDEDAAFRELLRQETNREVREMELSYYGKIAQEAKQEGRQEGHQEMLLQLLQAKFGQLPHTATDRIKAIQSQGELIALATKALTAESLADIGLDGAA